MKTIMRLLLLSSVLAIPLALPDKAVADDDDYWDGYWSWYDGTYRPYYHRNPYGDRFYDRNDRYDRYYDGGYYGYGGRYRGNYYGTPRFGYRDMPGGGGQVRVGPLRFGWR